MTLQSARLYVERYEVHDGNTGEVIDRGHDLDGADEVFNDHVDAARAEGDPTLVRLVAVLCTGTVAL
ncbi:MULTISPECIES: hypothetical protein [unclassified Burkholderia]|uniref:hypothetical protein n=1 Tax=unclassified Burkholderia TaxID=2613784 RepID=UPI002AB0C589|nr:MULTISPECIES: hypothetical protein [unclassified Burkholderia]